MPTLRIRTVNAQSGIDDPSIVRRYLESGWEYVMYHKADFDNYVYGGVVFDERPVEEWPKDSDGAYIRIRKRTGNWVRELSALEEEGWQSTTNAADTTAGRLARAARRAMAIDESPYLIPTDARCAPQR